MNNIGDAGESTKTNLDYTVDDMGTRFDHKLSNSCDEVDGENRTVIKPAKPKLSYFYEDCTLHDTLSIEESDYFELEKLTETEVDDDEESEDASYFKVEKAIDVNEEQDEGRKGEIDVVKRQLSFQI